jgi:predicted phage tail protein
MEAIQFLMDLLSGFTSLGIFSPVDVEITDPLGRTLKVSDEGVTELEFPAIAVEEDGHKLILMPQLPGMRYTVNLTGTDAGNYRMEVSRVVGRTLVTQEVFGNTTPGESDLYSVTTEGSSLDLAKQGVSLAVPQILSGSSLQLTWTEYTEPDFLSYEVLVSDSVDSTGEIAATVTDSGTTSATITGLSPERTYFFSVRVVTDGGQDSLSNVVGAAMPSDYTLLLLLAAAVGAGVVLLMAMVVFWKRRGS